ncbi:T9SS type A sorting domain-containing protein, partial [candidate division WOR-3 bacterium]|nr:T9SS type A sorting domain-containing protein [candidate division WOR-3 bacterium]
NNNGMIEPGETGDLMVSLLNSGQGHAYGVTATLRSGDARLAVLDSLGGWGTIMRDSTGRNSGDRFRVQADPGIPRETRVPCTLAITVGGAEYVRVFELGIGEIRACDPIPDGPRAPALYYAYDSGDSLYTQAPRFEWVEISGVGTRLTLSDDQTVQVSLGAFGPWRFYGQDFSQVSICGNGFVAPGSHTYSSYSNTALPQSGAPGMVCLNWDDLYPPTGGGVWWFHDAANHRFIVEWDSVHYYGPREDWDKYQLVLYDTTVATPSGDNAFTVQHLTANRASSSTVGIQNPGHDVFIQYLFDGDYHRGAAALAPGLAVRYTTDPPNVGVVEEGAEGAGFSRLALLPCAPNPARSGARFRFQVGVETRVRLAVYDASGRRVARLFDGKARPGSHTVTWDGRDDSGRRTARGVYLYRLETGAGSISRKLVVVD